MLLARFAGAIKSSGFDVILDICSEVEISNAGGISQWIPRNIKLAEKILLVLTPRYLSALHPNIRHEIYEEAEFTADVCKVNSETNYIHNLVYNDTCSSKNVLLIRKDVHLSEIPSDLQNYHSLEFPDKFEQKDLRFRA